MTHAQIINLVADRMGVTYEQMQGKLRKKTIVAARHMATYLLWKHTKFSLKEIGTLMGGRDHSTAIHARDTMMGFIDTNQYPANEIAEIERIIKDQAPKQTAITEMSDYDLIANALEAVKKRQLSFAAACLTELLSKQNEALVAMSVDQKMFEEVN